MVGYFKETIEMQVPGTRSHSYSLHTYLSRVLLDKLTGFHPVNIFLSFYGTRRIITAVTSVRHLSLSWARSIEFTRPHSTSGGSVLILSSHLCLVSQVVFFL